MAKQTILWTVLPYGRFEEGPSAGRRRVSIMVSPRLTPESADEQTLGAFGEFLDWPATFASANFSLTIGSAAVGLTPVSAGDSGLWRRLFDDTTPVAGFQFKDMSKVNLHSYAVRNVLGYLRHHYGRLAVQAASEHPTLLPWKAAHPDLKDMLSNIGTRTFKTTLSDREIEVALPGFSRFFDDDDKDGLRKRLERQVFDPEGMYRMKVPAIDAQEGGVPAQNDTAVRRTLPADWYDPRPGGPGAPLVGGPDAALMDQFASADEYAFYQASRFYRREPPSAQQRRMRRPSYQNQTLPPPPPEYDFHRIVASFADYPLLLRALSLTVDCVMEDEGPIDAAIAAGGGVASGHMSLKVDVPGGHDAGSDSTPRTAWQADEKRFLTKPRGDHLSNGLLRLENSHDGYGVTPREKESPYDIYQVDPDGAAQKTIGFTLSAQNLLTRHLSLRQIDGEVTYTTGDKQSVAALRSGGLGVSQHGRAEQVAVDAAAANLKNQAIEAGNAAGVVLFAEDVQRGYRVDVAPVEDELAPGPWHTLCARDGRYKLIANGETLPLGADEGYVSGASTSSSESPGVDPDDHYLHESLFRWTGWSLCAPRPGLTLRAEPVPNTQLQGERPTTVADKAANGNGVEAQFKALKGSLPKLRFGQLYRFRARVVDVAGNSLSVDDPAVGDLEHASDAVGYWRFEPVDPPAMMQRARLSEGESLERMVIRSNYNVDPSEYLASADFAASIALPESQDFEYTANNERHLVPPKSSQQQCEQHGLFDQYFSNPQTIKEGYAIAAREAGTLFDATSGSQIELVTPDSLANVSTTSSVPPELPGPENPVGDRLSGGQYIIHREASIETPYLPDGASGGCALRAARGHSIPGVTGPKVLGPSCAIVMTPNQELVLMISHSEDWPKTRGFRLLLAERTAQLTELPCNETFADDGEPLWVEESRTLTLFVSKGRIVRLKYSSFAHPDVIRTFGIPRWTPDTQGGRDFVMGMAVMGASWMVTPHRQLTLVHATQQPLCLPQLVKLSVNRQPGGHVARLSSRVVRLHGPSTGKFEVEASWHEWVDDLARDEPQRIAHKGQLGEILLEENHRNQFPLITAVNAQITDASRPRARADEHDLGDTRFRLIRYQLRATTRFREYLPPSLYADTDKVTRLGPVATGPRFVVGAQDDPGAPVLHDPAGSDQQSVVWASASPDDPRVLYVVPTFRWQHSESGGTQRVTRHGNGLRVWLDRPWFSSGDGELLGVIIAGDGTRFTDVPADKQPLVTQWGLDPLWDTAVPKSKTRIGDFPARVHAEQVTLQERPDSGQVSVIGHRVHWDAERHLWYCDIELNPGASYMPFVRLALVRYQPNALQNAKISKVVLSEFAQVLPRRYATARVAPDSVKVSLRGPVASHGPMKFNVDSEYTDVSFLQGRRETGRNRVELVLQTREPEIDSDLAWEDEEILASSTTGSRNVGGIFAERAVTAAGSRTIESRAGRAVRIGADVDLTRTRPGVVGVGITPGLVEPVIWSATADLPDVEGKPSRLMLREFERYYTDRTVPHRRGNSVHRRRVIEERLVYAAIFDSGD